MVNFFVTFEINNHNNQHFLTLQIRLDLQDSLYYRILSNNSHTVCVCSNEARSVRFNIVPKKLGKIPLTVIAKDVDSSVCGEGVQQMAVGVTDAVKRELLVEVHHCKLYVRQLEGGL